MIINVEKSSSVSQGNQIIKFVLINDSLKCSLIYLRNSRACL